MKRAGLLALALAAPACGSGGAGADASVVDAALPDDAAPDLSGDPEGGNVWFDELHLSPAVAGLKGTDPSTPLNRIVAYFVTDMQPQANPLPTPGACANLYDTGGWPLGGKASTVLTVDVGDVRVTGRNAAGASKVDVLARNVGPGIDDLGRAQGGRWFELLQSPATDFVAPDQLYDVALDGTVGFPSATYPGALYLPAPFDVIAPAFDDLGLFTAGTDATVTWQPVALAAETHAPVGEAILGIVLLVDPANGSPVLFCTTDAAAGTYTITGADLQGYRDAVAAVGHDPSQAILVRQNSTWHTRRLYNGATAGTFDPNNPRRVDFLASEAWAQYVTVAAAP